MVTVEVRTVEGYNLALVQWFHCIVPSPSFYDMSDSKLQYCSNVTRFSILGSFRESRIKSRVLIFEVRELSVKDRVSRHSKYFSRISNRDFEETI